MIYFDNSATTFVDPKVLETFNKVCTEYPGNSNSIHSLGVKSKELEEYATEKIARLLNVKPSDIIYTSGASESNNTVLKGVASRYKNRGNHIITTHLEHSSTIETVKYLESKGFIIDYVKINKDGYYQTIVKDLEKGNFQTNFLDKISNLNLKYLCNHLDVLIVKIINHNQDILKVTFSQNQATLEILDTKIIYHFYYSHIIDEFTKYDIRNFEYKEPTVLYSKILEKINFLINKEYIYTYTKKQVSLITTLDNVEVYNVKVNKKLFEKENKNHKTITL